MTGLRSSSRISGISSARREIRSSTSRSAATSAARLAAIALEQLEAANLVQELVGVAVGERRDAKVHVADQFDVDAAESEPNQRPEQRIGGHADHRLDAALQHRLEKHGGLSRRHPSPRRAGQDLVERAPDRVLIREVEQHAADVGFVLDARGMNFRDHGEAKHRGGRGGVLAVVRDGGGDERDIERMQHPPQFVVGEPGGAARLDRRAADRARLVRVDVIESPQQPGRLAAPFRVRGDLRDGADRVLREGVDRDPFVRRLERLRAAGASHHARDESASPSPRRGAR